MCHFHSCFSIRNPLFNKDLEFYQDQNSKSDPDQNVTYGTCYYVSLFKMHSLVDLPFGHAYLGSWLGQKPIIISTDTDPEEPNFLHSAGLETLLLGTNFKQCYGSASPWCRSRSKFPCWSGLASTRCRSYPKSSYQLFHLFGNDTDPDPAKWCGSVPIRFRIRNTDFKKSKIEKIWTDVI